MHRSAVQTDNAMTPRESVHCWRICSIPVSVRLQQSISCFGYGFFCGVPQSSPARSLIAMTRLDSSLGVLKTEGISRDSARRKLGVLTWISRTGLPCRNCTVSPRVTPLDPQPTCGCVIWMQPASQPYLDAALHDAADLLSPLTPSRGNTSPAALSAPKIVV